MAEIDLLFYERKITDCYYVLLFCWLNVLQNDSAATCCAGDGDGVGRFGDIHARFFRI